MYAHSEIPFSGDNRARTCDLLHVKQTLSQLSYVSVTKNSITESGKKCKLKFLNRYGKLLSSNHWQIFSHRFFLFYPGYFVGGRRHGISWHPLKSCHGKQLSPILSPLSFQPHYYNVRKLTGLFIWQCFYNNFL